MLNIFVELNLADELRSNLYYSLNLYHSNRDHKLLFFMMIVYYYYFDNFVYWLNISVLGIKELFCAVVAQKHCIFKYNQRYQFIYLERGSVLSYKKLLYPQGRRSVSSIGRTFSCIE